MRRPLLIFLGSIAFGWMLWGFGVSGPGLDAAEDSGKAENQAPSPDPLASFGLHETKGAAAGYVEDRACRFCHTDIYDSYQEVGMAQSFYRPSPDRVIEDLGEIFFHEASGRYYEMTLREGRYVFRRYLKDQDGKPVHVFEQPVDWILGSGHRSRTYLVGTAGGELYQLPLAWYSQTKTWGMAPGFDNANHHGLKRRVRRECMFCHNAYPEVPSGSDAYWEPQVFPTELPQGTGCQRCHGPGAEHVRQGQAAEVDFALVGQSILNPADLPPRRRDDICDSCHLQPSVAFFGLRRFHRGDYSFRPGEPLSDYLVHVDVAVENQAREERFEINHHPYRLRQSPCYVKSDGALGCTNCHNPHRKVPIAERASHYQKACLKCHTVEACDLERMTLEARETLPETVRSVEPSDCVACHMQERRPQDVVGVTMTDHFIRRRPLGAELVAPLKESVPIILDASLLGKGSGGEALPQGSLWDVYRATAVLRAGSLVPVNFLERALVQAKVPELEPYLELARGRLHRQDFVGARRALSQVIAKDPKNPRALEWLALVASAAGSQDTAMGLLQQVLEADGGRAESMYNLGRLQFGAGLDAEALASLDRALDLRLPFSEAWYYRGRALRRLNRIEESEASLRRSLVIDPTFSRAYVSLADLLVALGRSDEARSLLNQASRWGAKKENIDSALKALDSLTPSEEDAASKEF